MANDSRSFTYEDALERAQRGAALLDEKVLSDQARTLTRRTDLADEGFTLSRHPGTGGAGRLRQTLAGLGLQRSVFGPDAVRHGFSAGDPNIAGPGYALATELLVQAWREVLSS